MGDRVVRGAAAWRADGSPVGRRRPQSGDHSGGAGLGPEGARRRGAQEPRRPPQRPDRRCSQEGSASAPVALRALGRARVRQGRRDAVYDRGVVESAQKAWKAAKLAPIGLHEARHTFASLMIAAGVNAKALSTYLGHASVTITYDRYGHLMPGNEDQAALLLDKLLAGPQVGPQAVAAASLSQT